MRLSSILCSFLVNSLVLASAFLDSPRFRHGSLFKRAASVDGTCGGTGGSSCAPVFNPYLTCCSQYGWCGNSTAHCGTGCQPGFGTCGSSSSSSGAASGATSGKASATATATSATAASSTASSTYPLTTDETCGPLGKNQTCAPGDCCSPSGWCGTGETYCAAPDCFTDFGPGCDSNQWPPGPSTANMPRPLLGSVLLGGGGIFPCAKTGTFALTFDDGPGAPTSSLLDMLDKYNAKATFFITGNNIGKGQIDDPSTPWPAVIRRMYQSNHQIASHTWSHADLSTLTQQGRKDEMIKNEMALSNILGLTPTYMRPPYSSCTSASGCPDDLASLGYHAIYFDLDTQDYLHTTPDTNQLSKDVVTQYLSQRTPATGNYLSVAHDIHDQSVNNLTAWMLPILQQQNWTMVTVGDCLNDPRANWYRVTNASLLNSLPTQNAANASSSSSATSAPSTSVSSAATATTSTASSGSGSKTTSMITTTGSSSGSGGSGAVLAGIASTTTMTTGKTTSSSSLKTTTTTSTSTSTAKKAAKTTTSKAATSAKSSSGGSFLDWLGGLFGY